LYGLELFFSFHLIAGDMESILCVDFVDSEVFSALILQMMQCFYHEVERGWIWVFMGGSFLLHLYGVTEKGATRFP
jgi:hypothetical protein